MNKKLISTILYIVAVLLVGVAVVYFTVPANHLPGFFPGHDASLTKRHVTHGIGALVVAIVAVVIAWFQGGPKRSPKQEQ